VATLDQFGHLPEQEECETARRVRMCAPSTSASVADIDDDAVVAQLCQG
jgi:hypothetical protein